VPSRRCKRILLGHTHTITALVTLPGGVLASGSLDDTVRVWDATVGKCLQVFKGNCHGINALVVLPGEGLASGGGDGTIRTWNVSSPKCQHLMVAHRAGPGVTALVVLPNGYIASGGLGSVRIWDPTTGDSVRVWDPPVGGEHREVEYLLVLPTGVLLIGVIDDPYNDVVLIWDIPGCRLSAKVQREAQLLSALHSYVSAHAKSDPVSTAARLKLFAMSKYLDEQGFGSSGLFCHISGLLWTYPMELTVTVIS